jgi:predicted CXXCH cytochrome family protein
MGRMRKRKGDVAKPRVPAAEPTVQARPTQRSYWRAALFIAGVSLVLLILAAVQYRLRSPASPREGRSSLASSHTAAQQTSEPSAQPRFFLFDKLALMWDRVEPRVRQELRPTSNSSNILPQDYAGPEACSECHQANYTAWSEHPHRWMNTVASEETTQGDFSGTTIQYRHGVASFYRQGEEFRMRYEREDLQREYRVTQTIGSRFYQYYVGVGLEGPEPEGHDYYKVDFVLPFGYWLDRKAWVPVVHIFEELPESQRWDLVEHLKSPEGFDKGIEGVGSGRGVVDHSQELGVTYARSCNFCHTTFSFGDIMVRNPKVIGPSLPEDALLELDRYTAASKPELWSGTQAPAQLPSADLKELIDEFYSFDAREHAVTLGVSCEACHLGCRKHVEDESSKPAFTAQSPHFLVFRDSQRDTGRTQANINAACARCHSGDRPTFAAGMSTWNSTEHSDAMRGSCYSELSCINCHDPHKATGKSWTKTPEQDDASCLSCHEKYQRPELRQVHTRHAPGSAGDRCLNCHMPKINEGMQDVVRTHTIFSPTHPAMIEANQPNACNLCHLDKSIDWTLQHLKIWYNRNYDDRRISESYADRSQPVGIGWLKQSHASTRLVATEAFGRQAAQWGLSAVIELLDDPYLLNRQFAQKAVETLTGVQLDESEGYWYYMTADERQPLIEALRKKYGQPQ